MKDLINAAIDLMVSLLFLSVIVFSLFAVGIIK